MNAPAPYRGRIAPSPTGYLHLGHARTFWIAFQRAATAGGTLVFRNEDLDRSRCRKELALAMLEDLTWFGIDWQEGPDRGGPFAPYTQSERLELYRNAFSQLSDAGHVYPCRCSRQDVARAARAPHAGEDEPIYPGTCRPGSHSSITVTDKDSQSKEPERINWRFRIPDGEVISFHDRHCGPQAFVAGADFGDFIVWRHDDIPSYQLAVVVDDATMGITEVVRGEDLLRSTARQLLLYRALRFQLPEFYHCPLMTDAAGVRLAKRHDALSLRALRAKGLSPRQIREQWGF